MMTDKNALDVIACLMGGEEWDADTLDLIAEFVRHTGRTINKPSDMCPHGDNWDDCPDCRH